MWVDLATFRIRLWGAEKRKTYCEKTVVRPYTLHWTPGHGLEASTKSNNCH